MIIAMLSTARFDFIAVGNNQEEAYQGMHLTLRRHVNRYKQRVKPGYFDPENIDESINYLDISPGNGLEY